MPETNTADPAVIEEGGEGAVYTKSTQQMYLEERELDNKIANGEAEPEEVEPDLGRDFSGGASEEELEAYVGVDPVYRNHASERDVPRMADEDSAEGQAENRFMAGSDMIVSGLPQEYLDAREEREAEVAEHNEKAARGGVVSHVENAPVTAVTARESDAGEGLSQSEGSGTSSGTKNKAKASTTEAQS